MKAGDLDIPEEELTFTTSRSSGPGGQNVNKVNTRVTLLFDVSNSPSLSDRQRELVREHLAGRINRDGILRVTSQRHRTQSANREAATARFAALLAEALSATPSRLPTTIPTAVNERRLEGKRRRSRVKQERAVDLSDED
jgi:ribosome-associated protein